MDVRLDRGRVVERACPNEADLRARSQTTVEGQLGFDPTAGFHEYAIEYDPGSVRFLVDGVEFQRFTSGVTRSSMYLHVNAWFPSWLAGTRPGSDQTTSVDWVEYVSR